MIGVKICGLCRPDDAALVIEVTPVESARMNFLRALDVIAQKLPGALDVAGFDLADEFAMFGKGSLEKLGLGR